MRVFSVLGICRHEISLISLDWGPAPNKWNEALACTDTGLMRWWCRRTISHGYYDGAQGYCLYKRALTLVISRSTLLNINFTPHSSPPIFPWIWTSSCRERHGYGHHGFIPMANFPQMIIGKALLWPWCRTLGIRQDHGLQHKKRTIRVSEPALKTQVTLGKT